MMHLKTVLSILSGIWLFATISAYTESVVSPEECIPLETDPAVLQLNDRVDVAVSEAAIRDNPYGDSVVSALEANLDASGNAYDSMMKSFYENQTEAQKDTDDVYTVSGITADGFPDSYAGAYINKNKDLVVLMTESSAAAESSLLDGHNVIIQAVNSSKFILSTAKYSYKYLVSVMNDILQYLKQPKAKENNDFSIISYCIDDFNNEVVVGLADISNRSIASFKKEVCDSPAIRFKLAGTSEQMDFDSVSPGD